jgi:parallel beta-helix repeat protein
MLNRNNALNNDYGILLESSSNNTLNRNNASNYYYGIYLSYSSNNILSSNTISNNGNYYYGILGSGISLFSSSNNTIFNNFLNNLENVTDYDGTNVWNTAKISGTNIIGGQYIGGNFWAHPNGTGFSQTCADSNKDGICDSSYTLISGNVDYLPLTIPAGYSYISGKVMNNSIHIAGAVVTTNTSNTTNTDASGMYSLLVPTGTYNLTATSAPRFYTNSSITLIVMAGTTIIQDIELIKKPTGNIIRVK